MPPFTSALFAILSLAVSLVLADDGTEKRNPLGYIPTTAPAVIFAVIYIIVGLTMIFFMKRHGGWWLLAVPIGAIFMTAGLLLRIPFGHHSTQLGWYIAWNLPVVLSPCAFIAGAYIILGRLARHLHADEYLFIRPQRIATIFIWSDVITFLIQAGGGGISASDNPKTGKLGSNIFLAGIILQGVSFLLFCALFGVFLWNVKNKAPELWNLANRHGVPRSLDWRVLAGSLALSCVGIIIRSVYRIVELSQGYGGPLSENETLFYVLDTLPLAIAVGAMAVTWPQKFFSNGPAPETAQTEPKEPRV